MVFIVCDLFGAPISAFSTLKAAQYYRSTLPGQAEEYSIVKLAID